MIEVNLFDKEFIHTEQLLGYITCSDTLKPSKIKWLNGLMKFDGVTIFTDRFIDEPLIDTVQSKIKIFWLLEPRAINPRGYDLIEQIEDKFDYILTYDSELLNKNNKYIKYIVGQSRVSDEDSGLHNKTKRVSMIASNKAISEGHRFRHEVVRALSSNHNFDLWGSGYKYFTDKTEPLGDYYFSVSIMNSKVDNFFTEVLTDTFRLGTVPIFWGCPNISEYFDIDGIIVFDTIEELDNILENLTVDDYFSRLHSIKENLVLAQKYISTDDFIADTLKGRGII